MHCGAVNWIYRSITGLVLISREPGARKCGGFRSRQSEGDSESWPGAFSFGFSPARWPSADCPDLLTSSSPSIPKFSHPKSYATSWDNSPANDVGPTFLRAQAAEFKDVDLRWQFSACTGTH